MSPCTCVPWPRDSSPPGGSPEHRLARRRPDLRAPGPGAGGWRGTSHRAGSQGPRMPDGDRAEPRSVRSARGHRRGGLVRRRRSEERARPARNNGLRTAWQPFGMRWPDGSLRQAICLFATALEPIGERTLTLVPGPGPALPGDAVPMPEATIEVLATVDGATARAVPVRVRDLEANPLRRVELRRARLGDTGLLVDCTWSRAATRRMPTSNWRCGARTRARRS